MNKSELTTGVRVAYREQRSVDAPVQRWRFSTASCGTGRSRCVVLKDERRAVPGIEQPLDLSRRASRLLAENAALCLTYNIDDSDILNR